MMDEESVHVLSLEDDVGCVVAVGKRGNCLLRVAEQNKQLVARQSPVYQGVSITLAKVQGN